MCHHCNSRFTTLPSAVGSSLFCRHFSVYSSLSLLRNFLFCFLSMNSLSLLLGVAATTDPIFVGEGGVIQLPCEYEGERLFPHPPSLSSSLLISLSRLFLFLVHFSFSSISLSHPVFLTFAVSHSLIFRYLLPHSR